MEIGHKKEHPRDLLVWAWLTGLLILSVLASQALPRSIALVLIFGAAVVKALLVAWNYMHLKRDRLLLYALAIPVLLVILLTLVLFPDIVFSRVSLSTVGHARTLG
jgi:caa(3)-type oxidase subunit IV